jgi:hypothetical protein
MREILQSIEQIERGNAEWTINRKQKFFKNGYWISIISWPWSYTNKWQFEIAVLKWNKDKRDLCYTTAITDDVIGYLSPEEVKKYEGKIKNL